MAWWDRKRPEIDPDEKRTVPRGLWTKCDGCTEILYQEEIDRNARVCPRCGYHYGMSVDGWVNHLLDPGSFEETDLNLEPVDPLGFKDSKKYKDRLKSARKSAGTPDAFRGGMGQIEGRRVSFGAFEFAFMGGSMGSVVGEKVTRLFERALQHRCPAVLLSASGGARMQEGIFSLMQMAKTSAALGRLKAAGLPYFSVLLNPTTGGVAASFAMLGDVILCEPKALIGFAGPRVIEQTIRQKLPEGFQRSEFLLEHGMVDMIVERKDLRARLSQLCRFLGPAPTPGPAAAATGPAATAASAAPTGTPATPVPGNHSPT